MNEQAFVFLMVSTIVVVVAIIVYRKQQKPRRIMREGKLLERLNVSPKYLSSTVKRVTGHSVSSYIDRYTVPIVKDYLADERLSLSQIAERMNFTSLSYFSRYCSKHLGQSPSEYRLSLQPMMSNK